MSTAQPPAEAETAAELNTFFWRRLPLKAGRISPSLGGLFADGAYLSGWSTMGGLVMPGVFLLGFFLGWAHLGYTSDRNEIVYLYSAATMVGLILVSQLGTAIGLAALLGFAIGDLSWVTSPEGLQTPILGRLGVRLFTDVLLAGGLIGVPLAARGVARRLVKSPPPGQDGFPTRAAVQAALAFALTYLWTMSTSVQMQPAFRWQGMTPMTHGLYNQMAAEAWAYGAAAAFGVITRSAIEAAAEHRPGQVFAMVGLRRELAALRRPPNMLGVGLGAALKAAFLTLLFGTYLEGWSHALMVWGLILAVLAVREAAFGWMGLGATLRAKVPAVVRFPAAFVIAYLISSMTVKLYWDKTGTFTPMLVSVLISIVVYAALLPERTPAPAKTKGA